MKIEPEFISSVGAAYRVDVDAIARGQAHSTLAMWCVKAPWAHLWWSWYRIDVVHLRPVEGLRDATIHLPEATHEFFVMAIDPDCDVLEVLKNDKRPLHLTPINFAAQMICDSDESAIDRIAKTVEEIVHAQLSPDTDFMSTWIRRFGPSNIKSS